MWQSQQNNNNPYILLEIEKQMKTKHLNLRPKTELLKAVKEKLHTISKTTKTTDENSKELDLSFFCVEVASRTNPAFPSSNMQNEDLLSIEVKIAEIRESVKEMKLKQLDRIFREFIQHNYAKRYRVTPEIITSALIGEQYSLIDLSKLFNKDKNYLTNKI